MSIALEYSNKPSATQKITRVNTNPVAPIMFQSNVMIPMIQRCLGVASVSDMVFSNHSCLGTTRSTTIVSTIAEM